VLPRQRAELVGVLRLEPTDVGEAGVDVPGVERANGVRRDALLVKGDEILGFLLLVPRQIARDARGLNTETVS